MWSRLATNRWMTCCRGWNKPRNIAPSAKNDNKTAQQRSYTHRRETLMQKDKTELKVMRMTKEYIQYYIRLQ